jgi:hypothetical protein
LASSFVQYSSQGSPVWFIDIFLTLEMVMGFKVLQPLRDIEDNNKIKLLWKKHEQPHWYLNVSQLSRAWLKT